MHDHLLSLLLAHLYTVGLNCPAGPGPGHANLGDPRARLCGYLCGPSFFICKIRGKGVGLDDLGPLPALTFGDQEFGRVRAMQLSTGN